MDIREYLTRIKADADAALSLLPALPPSPSAVLVKAGESLQAALDRGGAITTEPGAIFAGNFVAKVAGTRLVAGAGSALAGANGGPALHVPPGARDIQAAGLKATTAWDQSVVQIGLSDTGQSRVEDAPRGVVLADIFVPKHRGKRAFEVHGADVSLLRCGCADVYDPAKRDSQGLLIWNAPGPVLVSGGSYEAASENILVGGAPTMIPNLVPNGLTFEDLTLPKRAEWRGNPDIPVKNNFELKAGTNVILRRSKIDGNWVSGQAGSSIVLTPRDGKTIGSVLLEDVELKNVVHMINMMSHDDVAYTPGTQGVVFRRVKGVATKRFLQMGGEFVDVLVEGCEFEGADTTIYGFDSVVWDSPAVKHSGHVSRGVRVLNNKLACRLYGVMLTTDLGGEAYGAHWQSAWPDGQISGNTFFGQTALSLKKNLPSDNLFVAA
jgi:hypothetical protein